MNFIEFLIGGLVANGLVHFIVGITKVKFLGYVWLFSQRECLVWHFTICGGHWFNFVSLFFSRITFEWVANWRFVGFYFLIFGPFLVRFYSK
jgi:hypothetical protein